MNKAKVKTVTFDQEWSKNDKTFYKFNYVLDDNGKDVALAASHIKKENAFKEGDEVSYEITGSNDRYGTWGTVSKPKEFKKGGYQKTPADYRAFAVAYAKDFYVGQIEPNMKSEAIADKVKSMFKLAVKIDEYIQEGKLPEFKKPIEVPDKSPEPPSQDVNVSLSENSDDGDKLPF